MNIDPGAVLAVISDLTLQLEAAQQENAELRELLAEQRTGAE